MKWIAAVVVLVVAAAFAVYRLYPRQLDLKPELPAPVWEMQDGQPVVRMPGAELVAQVAAYDDELYAYFNFSYLGGREALKPASVLLTMSGSQYLLQLHLKNNLLAAIPYLEGLRQQGYIPEYQWGWVAPSQLDRLRRQTHFFVSAYTLPVRRGIEDFTPQQVHEYVRRFVLFKSRTDPRVRQGVVNAPPTLTGEQARQISSDIIQVADFFWLPLDLFLGIGAQENNYMSVPGDIEHTVWKARADPGDIVLRRSRGRVLVRNYATGVWQITRETLRAVHKVYLKNEWDYSLLPERLRPPRELNLDEVDEGHLTFYAGLLFRDLIDRFDGDVRRAVGAYNGGPGNPNMRYEEGVRTVANYAWRMLAQTGALGGGTAAGTSFLTKGE